MRAEGRTEKRGDGEGEGEGGGEGGVGDLEREYLYENLLNYPVTLCPSLTLLLFDSPSSSPPQELYENVKREEFKVPGGEGNLAETFFNPEREGWLTKEGGKYKSKHRRWFILKESMLYYFKQPTVSSTI